MSTQPYQVHATWDAEAKVWVAESDEIAGLITEAATIEELLTKLNDIIPVLVDENHGPERIPEIPYSLMLDQQCARADRR